MPGCMFAQSLPLSVSVGLSMYKAVSDAHISTQRMSLPSTSLRTREEANQPNSDCVCAAWQLLPFSLPCPEPDLQGFRGTPVCAVQFQPFHVPCRKDANSTERMLILNLPPHPGLPLHPRSTRHRLEVRQADLFQAPERRQSLTLDVETETAEGAGTSSLQSWI